LLVERLLQMLGERTKEVGVRADFQKQFLDGIVALDRVIELLPPALDAPLFRLNLVGDLLGERRQFAPRPTADLDRDRVGDRVKDEPAQMTDPPVVEQMLERSRLSAITLGPRRSRVIRGQPEQHAGLLRRRLAAILRREFVDALRRKYHL